MYFQKNRFGDVTFLFKENTQVAFIDTAPPRIFILLPGLSCLVVLLNYDFFVKTVFPKDRICFVFHSLVSYFSKLCSLTYFRLIPWPLSIHQSPLCLCMTSTLASSLLQYSLKYS